jgi:transaldolase
MIQIDELRELYDASIQVMSATKRDLVESYELVGLRRVSQPPALIANCLGTEMQLDEIVISSHQLMLASRKEEESCRRKNQYSSVREAKERARHESLRIGEPLLAYECPFCVQFHIGHPVPN